MRDDQDYISVSLMRAIKQRKELANKVEFYYYYAASPNQVIKINA